MRVSLQQVLVWCILGGEWVEYDLEKVINFRAMLEHADPRDKVLFSNRIAAHIFKGDIPVTADLFVQKQLVKDPYVLQYAECEHLYLDGSDYQLESPYSFINPREIATDAIGQAIEPTVICNPGINWETNSITLDWSAAPNLKPDMVYLPVPDRKNGFDKIHEIGKTLEYTDTEVFSFRLLARSCTVNSWDVVNNLAPGKMKPPKGSPGRKPKFDWEEMWIKVAARLQIEDFPENQTRMMELMESVFETDEVPRRTVLMEKASKMMKFKYLFE